MRTIATTAGITLVTLAAFGLTAAGGPGAQVDTERVDGAMVVKWGGKEVLRYQVDRPADSKLPVESACYFHPLRTPGGTFVTDVAPADHPHHRGIFLAWFDVQGKKPADF